MELEYRLSDFIDCCLNEGQLKTARLCYLYAAEQKKITQETYIFLKKLADQKERFLKRQMEEFVLRTQIMGQQTDLSKSVDIFQKTDLPPIESCGSISPLEDIAPTSENVAKAAEGIKLKDVA